MAFRYGVERIKEALRDKEPQGLLVELDSGVAYRNEQVAWLLSHGGEEIEIFFRKQQNEETIQAMMEGRFFSVLCSELRLFKEKFEAVYAICASSPVNYEELEIAAKILSDDFLEFERSVKSKEIGGIEDTFEALLLDKEKKILLPQAFFIINSAHLISDKDYIAEYLAYVLLWPSDFFKDVIGNLRTFFHDLRNPLAAMLGYAQIMERRPEVFMPKLLRVFQTVNGQLELFIMIFEGLDNLEHKPIETSLKDNIDDVIKSLIDETQERRIKIQYQSFNGDIKTLIQPGLHQLLLKIFFDDFLYADRDALFSTELNFPFYITLDAGGQDSSKNAASLKIAFIVSLDKENMKEQGELEDFFQSYFSTPFRKTVLEKANMTARSTVESAGITKSLEYQTEFVVSVELFFNNVKLIKPKT